MSQLITTQQDLESFCSNLRNESPAYIAVDTEFMREKTYYPILCLIQVASPHHVAAIDPLVGLDLKPFLNILMSPDILKVFHAAYQDLEIFYYMTGQVPTPLFDTQVAAMVCGFGESISYEALVNSLAKSSIDKGSRFTDWSHRPLTDRQLNYALGDVTHLRVVYEKLQEKLTKTGRTSWIQEEMYILSNTDTYRIDPFECWKKIRYRNMKPKGLAYLRELAALREIVAQRRDIPRQRILKDETLLEISASIPKHVDQLKRIRGISDNQALGPLGKEILSAIQRVSQLPESEYPESPKSQTPSKKANPSLMEMLKLLLKIISEENEVAPKLVASSKDIERLARGSEKDLPLLHGWRYEVFGKQALELMEGRIGLGYDKGRIKFIRM